MALIEPTKKEVTYPGTKRYSFSLRLWHWVNLIVISGSLITVLINSTLTDKHATATAFKESLSKNGANVTDAQIKSIAGELEDSVWGVHIYFGYGLAALLVFRLILEFFQVADQKLIRKISSAYHQFKETKRNRKIAKHELTVRLIYSVFYLLITVMVVTGLFLAFEDALVAYKSIRPTVKDVHGFCMYLILAFIAVHIIGVLLAERNIGKGIVSDMINGGSEDQSPKNN